MNSKEAEKKAYQKWWKEWIEDAGTGQYPNGEEGFQAGWKAGIKFAHRTLSDIITDIVKKGGSGR